MSSSSSDYTMTVNSQGNPNYRANPSHGELMDQQQPQQQPMMRGGNEYMNYLGGFHGAATASSPRPPASYGGDGDGGGSHYTRDLSLSLSAQKTSHQLQANECHDQVYPNLHDNLRTPSGTNADSTVAAHHHHHEAPLSGRLMELLDESI